MDERFDSLGAAFIEQYCAVGIDGAPYRAFPFCSILTNHLSIRKRPMAEKTSASAPIQNTNGAHLVTEQKSWTSANLVAALAPAPAPAAVAPAAVPAPAAATQSTQSKSSE
jgi:hypothetical protein